MLKTVNGKQVEMTKIEVSEYLASLPTAEEIAIKLLQKAKDKKLIEIENDYMTDENTPVIYNEISFIGGGESVSSIDKYVRLNRLAGNTEHTIWDANKVDRVLSDNAVNELMLAIGGESSANQFRLKDRKKAVYEAIKIEDLEGI